MQDVLEKEKLRQVVTEPKRDHQVARLVLQDANVGGGANKLVSLIRKTLKDYLKKKDGVEEDWEVAVVELMYQEYRNIRNTYCVFINATSVEATDMRTMLASVSIKLPKGAQISVVV